MTQMFDQKSHLKAQNLILNLKCWAAIENGTIDLETVTSTGGNHHVFHFILWFYVFLSLLIYFLPLLF